MLQQKLMTSSSNANESNDAPTAPLGRKLIARMLSSAWLRLTTAGTSGGEKFQEDRLVDALLKENSIALVGARTSPLSKDAECTASVVGDLSWTWSGATVEDVRGTCTSLRVNIERMNIQLSKTTTPRNDAGGECEALEAVKSKAAEMPKLEPALAEWLRKVSSKSEISIERCNIRIEEGMQLEQSLSVIFETVAKNNMLGLLSGEIGNSSMKLAQDISYHRLAVKRINVIHANSNERNLRCQIHDYFGCGRKWSVGMLAMRIPILTCQLDFKLLGMNVCRTEDEFKAGIKMINQLCLIRGGEAEAKYLKYVLQNTSLAFCRGKLRINLHSQVSLISKPTNRTANLENVPLPFSVQLHAPVITASALTGDEAWSMENTTILLLPAPQLTTTTAISFHAGKIKFNNFLELRLVSGHCSINTATFFADNFSVNIDSASFVASNQGIRWLQVVMTDAKHPDKLFSLPYAQISSIRVSLLPKGLMTVFHDNVAEISSIVGEGDATSSSLILLLADRLMEEVNERRNLQKERRADAADSVAITAGSMLVRASMATPVSVVVGAGVAVASLGVRDTIGSAVAAGKESRGATEHEGYRFGDFTRGVVRKLSSKDIGERNQSQSSGVDNPKPYIVGDKRRLAGVGGMSAGALVGTALLGPVGFVAGSLIGSRVARASVSEENRANDAKNDALRLSKDSCDFAPVNQTGRVGSSKNSVSGLS